MKRIPLSTIPLLLLVAVCGYKTASWAGVFATRFDSIEVEADAGEKLGPYADAKFWRDMHGWYANEDHSRTTLLNPKHVKVLRFRRNGMVTEVR